jgi:hypothetical protein
MLCIVAKSTQNAQTSMRLIHPYKEN